jgi:predicted dehydrogenase
MKRPRIGSGDPVVAFTREIQAAIDAVNTGTVCSELSGDVARTALALCFKEVEAVRTSRSVKV